MFGDLATPLYDMRTVDWSVHAVLSVSGRGDIRHSLGVPSYVSLPVAVQTARRRGWKVIGIWRTKSDSP